MSEIIRHAGEFGVQFQGDPQVIVNLVKKAQNPENDSIQNKLILPGGGQQCGTTTTGVAVAVHREGLTKGISRIDANSSGAAVGYFLISGREDAPEIFYERNPQNKLSDLLRWNKIFDIKTLAEMMRDEYPIDIEQFQKKSNQINGWFISF